MRRRAGHGSGPEQAAVRAAGLRGVLDTELQPGFRWIEMTPADGGATLALVKSSGDLPFGIDTDTT